MTANSGISFLTAVNNIFIINSVHRVRENNVQLCTMVHKSRKFNILMLKLTVVRLDPWGTPVNISNNQTQSIGKIDWGITHNPSSPWQIDKHISLSIFYDVTRAPEPISGQASLIWSKICQLHPVTRLKTRPSKYYRCINAAVDYSTGI